MKINLRSILQTTRTQEQFPLFVLSAEKSFRHVSILAKFLDDKKPKFGLGGSLEKIGRAQSEH